MAYFSGLLAFIFARFSQSCPDLASQKATAAPIVLYNYNRGFVVVEKGAKCAFCGFANPASQEDEIKIVFVE